MSRLPGGFHNAAVYVRKVPLVLLMLIFLASAFDQITNHQLKGPTRVEVNLGPRPVGQYDIVNCLASYPDCASNVPQRYVAGNASTVTVRRCGHNALNVYDALGGNSPGQAPEHGGAHE